MDNLEGTVGSDDLSETLDNLQGLVLNFQGAVTDRKFNCHYLKYKKAA